MKYRAVIKQAEGWWIGWLIDLPGVNAQERTREDLIQSLRIGAEEILDCAVPFDPGTEMITVDVEERDWAAAPVGEPRGT
ncbi:MAG: type II toxin-antitoxin system HicB family antitoxin [bacterium]